MMDADLFILLIILFLGTLYYDVKASKIFKITFLAYFYLLSLIACSYECLPRGNVPLWSNLYDVILIIIFLVLYVYIIGFNISINIHFKSFISELCIVLVTSVFVIFFICYYDLTCDVTIFNVPYSHIYDSGSKSFSGILNDSFWETLDVRKRIDKEKFIHSQFIQFCIDYKYIILSIGGVALYLSLVYYGINEYYRAEAIRLECIECLKQVLLAEYWLQLEEKTGIVPANDSVRYNTDNLPYKYAKIFNKLK